MGWATFAESRYQERLKRSGMHLREEERTWAARKNEAVEGTHRASQPWCFKPAYVLMKPSTESEVSSCSRPMIPGEASPTAQPRSSFSRSTRLFGPPEPHDLRRETDSRFDH